MRFDVPFFGMLYYNYTIFPREVQRVYTIFYRRISYENANEKQLRFYKRADKKGTVQNVSADDGGNAAELRL